MANSRPVPRHLLDKVQVSRLAWGVAALACLGAILWGFRRRGHLAPERTNASDEWRQRAINAELQARQSRAVARSGLISQVARLLSNSFVGRLVSQRARLLESHRKTAEELEQLEARLGTVQAQMQNRLMAYERKIAELELELKSKDREGRTVIKTEIETVRRQWESERSKNVAGLN